MKTLRILATVGSLMPLLAQAQIDTGLIGYWPFEGDLVESSGNNTAGTHDGIELGTVGYVAGPSAGFGDAIDLAGGSGVLVDNTSSTFDPNYQPTFDADINTAGALTISFWASGAPATWSPFLAKYGEGTQGYQVRRLNATNRVTFTLRSTGPTADPTGGNTILAPATQPAWVHYVSVWDGTAGTRRLYINGVEDTTFTRTNDFSAGGPGNADVYSLTFGMRDNNGTFGNFFTGQIDDVAIWSRALSPTEVLQLSTNPLSIVRTQVDTDMDGLFDDDETNIHGTNPNLPDTDFDGVGDFAEVSNSSDALNDNDFDNDGLLNSQETSGSANPWTGTTLGTPNGDTTDWKDDDSDNDGVLDGAELSSANGSVSNPNDADTDDDGWSDGNELGRVPPSDPTNPSDIPMIDSGVLVAGFDQRYVGSAYGAGNWPDVAGTAHATANNPAGFTSTTTPSGAAALENLTSGSVNGNILAFTRTVALGSAGTLTVQSVIRIDDTVGSRSGPYALNQANAWSGLFIGANAGGTNTFRGGNIGATGNNTGVISGSGGAPVAAGTWGVLTVTVDSSVVTPQLTVTFTDLETGVVLFSKIVDNANSLTGTGSLGLSTNGVLFGGEQGAAAAATNGWGGAIADVVVYNSLLTPAEIANNIGEFQNLYQGSSSGPVKVVSFGFDEFGDFNLEASNLDDSKTYEMRRSILLDGTDWLGVGTPFTGGTSNTFTDASPPAPKAFYSIFDVTP